MKIEKFGRFKNYSIGKHYGNIYLIDNKTENAVLKLTSRKNLICYDDDKKHNKAVAKFCKDHFLYASSSFLGTLKNNKKKINIANGVVTSI